MPYASYGYNPQRTPDAPEPAGKSRFADLISKAFSPEQAGKASARDDSMQSTPDNDPLAILDQITGR